MKYKIEYVEGVKEDLNSLKSDEKAALAKAISEQLGEQPSASGQALLRSAHGLRRLKIGSLSVVFQTEKSRVLVLKIGHEREVYGT